MLISRYLKIQIHNETNTVIIKCINIIPLQQPKRKKKIVFLIFLPVAEKYFNSSIKQLNNDKNIFIEFETN